MREFLYASHINTLLIRLFFPQFFAVFFWCEKPFCHLNSPFFQRARHWQTLISRLKLLIMWGPYSRSKKSRVELAIFIALYVESSVLFIILIKVIVRHPSKVRLFIILRPKSLRVHKITRTNLFPAKSVWKVLWIRGLDIKKGTLRVLIVT